MIRKYIFILLGIIFLTACTDGNRKDYAFSDLEIKVVRYDKLIYDATAMNSFMALQKMNIKFPRVTKILIEDVLELGAVNTDFVNEKLCSFYSDSALVSLMDDALAEYSDMSDIEEGLNRGFEALKKELPHIVVPMVYAQISALNQSVVVADNLLGFSIDKYLGEDYPLYRKYYYRHQRRTMKRTNIVPDCFMFYLIGQYPFEWKSDHRSFYHRLIYRGKMAWVIEQIFHQDVSGHFSLGYSDAEVEWCFKYKDRIVEWMQTNGYFESTDPILARMYLLNTHPLNYKNKVIPPSFGIWLGLQLVDDYMKDHPEMSIRELLECNNLADLINNHR